MKIKIILTVIASLLLLNIVCLAETKFIYPNEKIDFGLQKIYPDIVGQTVRERFEQRKAELPDEIPVVLRREIKGNTKLFVATDGNDSNTGTIEKPYKSLQKALNTVKNLKTSVRSKGVIIYMRGGIYPTASTIDINAFNSGLDNAPLCISAYNNEQVKFVGGESIPGSSFTKITDPKVKQRLYPLAQEKVMVCDLNALGITNYGQINYHSTNSQVNLFLDGEKQTLSRWPNTTNVTIGKVLDRGPQTNYEPDDGRGFEFVFDNQRPLNWVNDGDLGMFGSFYAEWRKEVMNIRSINKETSSIRTRQAAEFGLGALELKSNHYYYFNIFEELDMPGEWYLDRKEGKLYVYPSTDLKDKLYSLIIKDSNFINMNKANNVILNNLTFEVCSGSAIEVTDSTDNIIQDCTINKIAGKGIYILGGKNNGVIFSTIVATDGNPIRIQGSDEEMAALIPTRHFVQNCHIYGDSTNISNSVMARRTVGTIFSHNLVQNSSAVGIYFFDCAEAIAEYNELTGGPRLTADSAPFYVAGNFTCRGNHIRYNYIHHTSIENATSATIGIYFDDMNRDNLAYGNIINTVPTGFFTHNGQEQTIFNNIIMNKISSGNLAVNDGLTYWFPARDAQWADLVFTNSNWLELYFKGFVNPFAQPWAGRFPTFSELANKADELKMLRARPGYVRGALEDDLRSSKNYYVANNLIVNHGKINSSIEAKKATEGLETNYSTTDDPGFVDAKNNDFTLKPDSIVFEKIPGFQAPPFKKMGLLYTKETGEEKIKMGAMECILPPDKSMGSTMNESVVFDWKTSFGSVYYKIIIATDPELKNIESEHITEFSTYTTNLKNLGQMYYWKVIAYTTALGMDNSPVESPVWSFKTMAEKEIEIYGTVEKQYLQREINNSKKILEQIVEGDKLGEYKIGAKEKLARAIADSEEVLATAKIQGKLDKANISLQESINWLQTQANRGYRNIGDINATNWFKYKNVAQITSENQELVIKPPTTCYVSNTSLVTAGEALTFQMYIENLKDWMGIAKQVVQDSSPANAGTSDSYLIVFKPDVLELQKYKSGVNHGIISVVVNDSKIIKSKTWHNMKFAVIPTEQGVWITFSVDGKTVFDYIDKENGIYSDGYFGMAVNGNNGVVKIKPSDTVYTDPLEPKKD